MPGNATVWHLNSVRKPSFGLTFLNATLNFVFALFILNRSGEIQHLS